MTYPLTDIGDIANFSNGFAFKPEDWGLDGLPIIRIQNLTDPSKPYNFTTRKVPEKYLVNRGDVLVSWSATIDVFEWAGEIGKDTLVPCLAQMELREIRTDIKSDSSASDFVRLIWSYLLALHQTSATPMSSGNHPGLLMFDEPGQHSMAVDSQHALLKQLASETSLQSIVAASFDEAEEVFRQATEGVQFTLIEWDGKLLRPVNQA